MYLTRGYAFHAYEYGKWWAIVNYGVCVKGKTYYYEVLHEIIEVEFSGLVNLKFDPTVGRGVRVNKFEIVDVNESRRCNKFVPFILPS